MGQAKLRGTLEVRVKESQEAARLKEIKHKQKLAAEEAALTPEERARRKAERNKARMFLATTVGMIAGMELDFQLRKK